MTTDESKKAAARTRQDRPALSADLLFNPYSLQRPRAARGDEARPRPEPVTRVFDPHFPRLTQAKM